MEEDLPHPDPESQYSGTNAHLEMLKDMLMTYNMYDNKKVGMAPKSLSFLFPPWPWFPSSLCFSFLCLFAELTVGYVQGMSDLLSVIYAILQDDSDAFWCFCGFMDRMVRLPSPFPTLPRNHPPPLSLLVMTFRNTTS